MTKKIKVSDLVPSTDPVQSTLTPLKPKTMSKTTSIRIANNGTFINFDLESTNSKSISKVQKALVYRFFDYYDTLRAVGSKCFKATEPFNISMQINGVVMWDTKVSTQLEAKLKLINTPKGRAMFDGRLTNIIGFAIRCANMGTDEIIKDAEERLLEVVGK
jgi:hypothetical protein